MLGENGNDAASNKLDQPHKRERFTPLSVATEAPMSLVEQRDDSTIERMDTQDATRRGTDYETPQHTAGLIAGVDNANENAKDDNKVSQEVEQPKVQRTETEEPVENANPTDSVKVDESEEAMAATTSTERDCEVAENTTGEGGSQGQQRKTQQDGLKITDADAKDKRGERYVVSMKITGVPVITLVAGTSGTELERAEGRPNWNRHTLVA